MTQGEWTLLCLAAAGLMWLCGCACTAKRGIGLLNCPLCWQKRGSVWPRDGERDV